MAQQTTEKLKQALQELADLSQLEEYKNREKNELLRKVILQFDLSPLEEDFLRRTCQEKNG